MNRPPSSGPRRIWVLGPPGSGKSTVAVRLGEKLGVPPTYLDDLFWLPGWIERPKGEFRGAVEEVVGRECWVIEGNYHQVRRLFLSRAQLAVWLDLPLRVTLPRLIRRTFQRARSRRPCCNGNYESIRRSLTSRDSILWWALSTDRRRRRELEAELIRFPHVRLRNRGEIASWMAQEGAPAPRPGATGS